jgi:hypothetical protein
MYLRSQGRPKRPRLAAPSAKSGPRLEGHTLKLGTARGQDQPCRYRDAGVWDSNVEQDFLRGAGKLYQRATVCTSTASNGQ